MNRLGRVNLDLLKSKVVLMVTGGIILLLIVWWFAWMTPESNKLTNVQQQITTDQGMVAQLNAELIGLKAEKKLVLKELPYLKKVTTAIPPTEDPPGIVDSLNTLANQTGCDLLTVTPADTPSSSGSPGLSVIAVSLSISGPHSNVFAFLRDFYKMKRLMTISSVTLSPASSTSANILTGGDGQKYGMSLTADAYTTYVLPTGTA
jgi:Tfp pilus assembly protein PilO